MLSRSSAETRQLELLSDLSSLKLRYTALEKENLEMRGQLKRSEQDMITLVSQVQASSLFTYSKLENGDAVTIFFFCAINAFLFIFMLMQCYSLCGATLGPGLNRKVRITVCQK